MNLLERICLASGRKVEVLRLQKRKKPPNKMVRSVDAHGKQIVKIRMANDHSKWAIVDRKSEGWISGVVWRCTRQGYVVWKLDERTQIRMHNVVYGSRFGELVDHRNHNTFDNRRRNLRLADKIKNGHNMRKCRGRKGMPTSSRFKGVRWHVKNKNWTAYINPPHSLKKHLGSFTSETQAARAYNTAARKYFGRFACLNIL